eukprot:2535357-Rhodomonas_salina.2
MAYSARRGVGAVTLGCLAANRLALRTPCHHTLAQYRTSVAPYARTVPHVTQGSDSKRVER